MAACGGGTKHREAVFKATKLGTPRVDLALFRESRHMRVPTAQVPYRIIWFQMVEEVHFFWNRPLDAIGCQIVETVTLHQTVLRQLTTVAVTPRQNLPIFGQGSREVPTTDD